MARRKSRIPHSMRTAAKKQLQMLREEEATENQEEPKPRLQVSNQEMLEELRIERSKNKKDNRLVKRQARRDVQALRQEEGPKAKIEYIGFQPGDLVQISKRAFNLYTLSNVSLFEGATGVIVEQEDMTLWSGDFEKGRWVQVMGPNGLQQWDIRWCTHVEDMDEDEQ